MLQCVLKDVTRKEEEKEEREDKIQQRRKTGRSSKGCNKEEGGKEGKIK